MSRIVRLVTALGGLALIVSLLVKDAAARSLVSCGEGIHERPDYWSLTRESDRILIGTIVHAGKEVRLAVQRVLKGTDVPDVIEFPPAFAFETNRWGEYPLQYSTARCQLGEQWLVFLETDGPQQDLLLRAEKDDIRQLMIFLRDVLIYDSLSDEREKCAKLVQILIRGPYSTCAVSELGRFSQPQFLDLLAPLAHEPATRSLYLYFAEINPSPHTTVILREFLESDDTSIVRQAVSALRFREANNGGLSADIASHLQDDDPEVRQAAISALRYRGYRDASGRILECLSDPDPLVQAFALSWPWRDSGLVTSDILPRIRLLSRDSNDLVRAKARRALVELGDTRSFYYLWFTTLFDHSGFVRHWTSFGTLFRSRPVLGGFLVLCPSVCLTMFAITLAVWLRGRDGLVRGSSGGAVGCFIGLPLGYLTGVLHASHPFIHAFLLMPSICVPLGVVLSIVTLFVRKPDLSGMFSSPHDGARSVCERPVRVQVEDFPFHEREPHFQRRSETWIQ